MILEGYEAEVEALSVERKPAVDVRIDAVEDRQTGKILHAEHEGRHTFVGDDHDVRLKACEDSEITPAEGLHFGEVVKGRLPAEGIKAGIEERIAYPEQFSCQHAARPCGSEESNGHAGKVAKLADMK